MLIMCLPKTSWVSRDVGIPTVSTMPRNKCTHAHRVFPHPLVHIDSYVGVLLPFDILLYGANTFFALQIRHAIFLTVPSACTTSGAKSIPNILLTAYTTRFAYFPSRSSVGPKCSSTLRGATSGSRSKQFCTTGRRPDSTALRKMPVLS